MPINKSGKTVIENEISIEKKVAFLRQPQNYLHTTDKIIVKETHMSWVFMVNGFVYKLKKPVKYSFFDHRTLESRFNNCSEEVLINQQLGGDIYIGIVPLTLSNNGALQLEGAGKIVDWLVKMKRIPEENMLDYAIEHECIDENNVRRVARLLTEFYQTSLPVFISTRRHSKKLEADIFYNYNALCSPLFGLSHLLLKELTAGQVAFLTANYSLFNERIKNKKIIDAHGDLRPEHICLGTVPAIIDRLEFSRELRTMDIAEELSYLCMECEMLGNRTAGQIFLDEYRKVSGDIIPRLLITFYKIKKACLRAYLVARHLEEARYKDDPKWLAKANAYLKLAERYHQQFAT